MMRKLVRSAGKERNLLRENVIHVGDGFAAKEHAHVIAVLATLGPRLSKWDPRDVNVDACLQGRGGNEQRVILRTSLPGLPPLVAIAENPDISRALTDAKRELVRQIDRQKSARDPMSNRRLSATIRHPSTAALRRQIER